MRSACAVACISDISARSRARPGRTILADTTPRLGCSNVPAVRPRPPGLRRIIVCVRSCGVRAGYVFMFSAQLSARDIPCSSNQRDTCQSPSMLCFVSAHTMRMCGHSTVLPCFHGCALPVHVVQAPRTSVQFGAQCCSTVCLITCPCSPLLASTNHSFGSPGIRLRVDDHSVEMRSRGCCF